MDEHGGGESRTKLYSYANMVIIGKHAAILADTGDKVDVIPFTRDYEDMERVLIVDASVQYIFQYTAKVYVLILSDSLSVPRTYNNLIPMFITR